MRVLGHGYSGISKFTSIMNMRKPMTPNNYGKIISKVAECMKEVAADTMIEAAQEIREKQSSDDEEVVDTVMVVGKKGVIPS